jgi:hypothetical protein
MSVLGFRVSGFKFFELRVQVSVTVSVLGLMVSASVTVSVTVSVLGLWCRHRY